MKLGDLVHINAVGFYQGIGLIVEMEENYGIISYRVLESEGHQHYYSEDELEVVDEAR